MVQQRTSSVCLTQKRPVCLMQKRQEIAKAQRDVKIHSENERDQD